MVKINPSASMATAPVTTAFSGLVIAAYAGLQLRVGLYRGLKDIHFGSAASDGKEDEHLRNISRAGANLAEYAPLGLFALFLMESQRLLAPKPLCLFGTAFVAARAMHAVALSAPSLKAYTFLRTTGFLSTIVLLGGAGVWLFTKAYVKH